MELPLSEFHKNKKMKDGHLNTCKKCCNKYRKQRYEENREYELEIAKQWRKNNPQYHKQYDTEHKDERTEYKKQYNIEYRNTQIGKANTIAAGYKQADTEHGRENNINGQWIVNNIFTSKCIYCGKTDWKKLGCDRIDNTKGHTIDNVVCCCGKCNIERGTKPFEEFYKMKRGLT